MIVAVPAATPVTTPEVLTVATAASLVDQAAPVVFDEEPVRLVVAPSQTVAEDAEIVGAAYDVTVVVPL